MSIKITNLLLLGGAFIIAGAASATGISHYKGSDLSTALTVLALAVFAASAGLMWSAGVFRIQSAEWKRLEKMVGGEYSMRSAGIHGQAKGLSVYARVESPNNNPDYLDQTCATLSSAKHFFALTVTLPYRHQGSWRLLYRPKDADHARGEWHVLCETSRTLSQQLETAGVVDLLSGWDKFTVVKCDAESGEITLRYPAPHRFFCPTPEEVEGQIGLLQRAGETWQHSAQTEIAA